jgi:predicted TIM-barrel fold metal-dependent hydrolase
LNSKRIDTHKHVWDLDRLPYSWTVSKPPLNRSFSPDDYWPEVRDLGIEETILVEADVDEPAIPGETAFLLDLASRPESRTAGVVAAARPENPDFEEYIQSIHPHPKLVGIRRLLHVASDEVSRSQLFRENVRRLGDYGLSFDICVLARQLPLAIELVESAPRVQFILDHCGNPPIAESSATALSQWKADITRISTLTNVACKISGIVTQADHANWNAADLRPVVVHIIESFGWDRIMFGSDWPVCTLASSINRWLKALEQITSNESDEHLSSLFADNATRIYRLGGA